jgi:hypothetical protein
MATIKRTNNDLQNSTQKNKDRATRTSHKIWSEQCTNIIDFAVQQNMNHYFHLNILNLVHFMLEATGNTFSVHTELIIMI